MTVLICGGRTYRNYRHVAMTLDGIDAETRIDKVVTGGAGGADGLGFRWAMERGRNSDTYPAQWDKHGKAAGPIRNQQMLDEGKPDLVVAFPGGRGTLDMTGRAKKTGVRVVFG